MSEIAHKIAWQLKYLAKDLKPMLIGLLVVFLILYNVYVI